MPVGWRMPARKTLTGWEPRCAWLPAGAGEALFAPGMLDGDRCAWLDQHGCRGMAIWNVETTDAKIISVVHACADHVGHMVSEDHPSRVWRDGVMVPARCHGDTGLLEDLALAIGDCPFGWHDGKVIAHRATTDADVIAWLQRMRDQRGRVLAAIPRIPVAGATVLVNGKQISAMSAIADGVCFQHADHTDLDRWAEERLK
jgi:hypothetical protein